ncbi:MAG TPA: metal-dependent transcriptional regulator [Treponema sp.]|nr:metal-dependent transcriptional regulator [Treponema sp.]HCA20354.1 metal-dependent transcriptional regulator [Treponema sp.]
MNDIHESGEDYLEAILRLQKKNGKVRSIDVARHLNVSKPSVSRAMGILVEHGYLVISNSGNLELTEKGLVTANEIFSRHVLLTNFLMKIAGIGFEQAQENACRLEHDIDDDVKAGIKAWMQKNACAECSKKATIQSEFCSAGCP